jgi:ribonuclease BN (tRNA processing enzyme)
MSTNDFTPVTTFAEVIDLAKDVVTASKSEYILNFSVKVCFSANLLKASQLLDVVKLAEDFQDVNKPEYLYINHGHYITAKGLPHVVEELKNKHVGNRAIISLINQNDIIGSGDDPIPSFMILQFSLESDELYITTYFRALEVSKFLRINLEEIRLIGKTVLGSIRKFKTVKLNIFSFRAYINENINPLVRPKIELKDDIEILKLMEKRPKELCELLREKLTASTVVETRALKVMRDIANDPNKNQDTKACFKMEYTKRKLKECVELGTRLIELRKGSSHAGDIDEANTEYLKVLEELVREIEKCD